MTRNDFHDPFAGARKALAIAAFACVLAPCAAFAQEAPPAATDEAPPEETEVIVVVGTPGGSGIWPPRSELNCVSRMPCDAR